MTTSGISTRRSLHPGLEPPRRRPPGWRAARAAGQTIGARVDLVPRAGKTPLFAVFAMQRAGAAGVVSRLTVRDHRGEWTEEFRALRREMGMPIRA